STFSCLNVADGGFGSLRAAIAAANAQPGADVIHYTRQVRGTIFLTSGPLDITDDVEIRGPGARRLALSGSHLSRIFNISGGATVTIAGLTITEGMAGGGPGGGGRRAKHPETRSPPPAV